MTNPLAGNKNLDTLRKNLFTGKINDVSFLFAEFDADEIELLALAEVFFVVLFGFELF